MIRKNAGGAQSQPQNLYIASAPGVATRLGETLEKFMNVDTDVYPMMENLNKASGDFPELTSKPTKCCRI
jgi:hypothetical protein